MSEHLFDATAVRKLGISVTTVNVTHPRATGGVRQTTLHTSGENTHYASCRELGSKETFMNGCDQCRACYYCSPQCHIIDQEEHESYDSETRNRLKNLVTNLTTKTDLMVFLKLAVIFFFEMNNASSALNEPFAVLVPLIIEPEDLLDFARLRGELGLEMPADYSQRLRGMVQVCGISSFEQELLSKETLNHRRARLESFTGCNSDPFGVFVFKMGDSLEVVEISFSIPPEILKYKEEGYPFTQTVTTHGKYVSGALPMSYRSCLEYINTSIRLDKSNEFSLRVDMTGVDENIIRQTMPRAASSMEELPANLENARLELEHLEGKLYSEFIYKIYAELQRI